MGRFGCLGGRWGLLWCSLVGLLVLYSYRQATHRHPPHWMGFSRREARLADRLRESEDNAQWLRRQLRLAQTSHNKQVPGKSSCEDSVAICETIHVAIVCAGYNASRTVVPLLKSILFYRRNPIVFHFVSDYVARKILNHLAKTWALPHVTFRFYRAETVIKDVMWIPNKHYSGVYGLLKLTLAKILPEWVEKAIVLDTDVIFATDISKLWNIFRYFNNAQAIGLVENQSDWYIPGKLWKNHRPWPAIGRGYNTGVILVKLNKLNAINWSQLWRGVAENDLMTMLSTSLADQDIFNAVLRRQSELLYTLPCSWNLQLSDNSLSESLCMNQTLEVNIVHFNSPSKFNPRHHQAGLQGDLFRNLHLTFQQYDGNLLRKDLNFCDKPATSKPTELSSPAKDESCLEVETAGRLLYRTHLYFLPYTSPNASAQPVTLVLQMSMDRLHMLELIAGSWERPISLALYATDADTVRFLNFHAASALLTRRTNIAVHVVYAEGEFFPINYLRNVALHHVDTPYVFLCDMDFLPSKDMAASLDNHVDLLVGEEKRVLIVPALESEHYRPASSDPLTKVEVLKLMDLGEILTFRSNVWPQGHAPTNFPRWRTATLPYQVRWKEDFEPYIVTKSNIARYDTRFVGFGWNKVSHIFQLHASGYKFIVLPSVFILHLPHSPSMDIFKYRYSKTYRACLAELKARFKEEVLTGVSPGTGNNITSAEVADAETL